MLLKRCSQKLKIPAQTKVYLVFAVFATIGSFDIHDQDLHVLAFADPDTLGGLHPRCVGHDIKIGPKESVQQRA